MSSRIADLCKRHNFLLIEDNAQSVGCVWSEAKPLSEQSKKVYSQSELHHDEHVITPRTGSLGHASAHSFYPGKNLGALGDAGSVAPAKSMFFRMKGVIVVSMKYRLQCFL